MRAIGSFITTTTRGYRCTQCTSISSLSWYSPKTEFPWTKPYWADTINVAPGERYSVLVNADAQGVWVWHCHILTHVERSDGMFGMVTALIVQPNEEG